MNWADLRILLAITRADTLTAAGRSLGLDQTTVTRRLEQLESDVGITLVVRSRDGLHLTEAGERMALAAEQVETVVLDAQRDAVGQDLELRGPLRVTTPDIIALSHAELFTGFATRYPHVVLQVSTGFTQRSLARREADVALRFTPKPDAALFGRKLARFAYAPYAAEALAQRIGRRAALTRYPWLGWDPRIGARGIEGWMRKHLKGARIVGTFDTGASLNSAVSAGMGAAIMMCAYGDPIGLVRLRPPVEQLGYDLWALTHEDLRRTARVRAFLQHAAEYIQARRAGLEGRRRPRASGSTRAD